MAGGRPFRAFFLDEHSPHNDTTLVSPGGATGVAFAGAFAGARPFAFLEGSEVSPSAEGYGAQREFLPHSDCEHASGVEFDSGE